MGDIWCVLGDFNVILCPAKMKGVRVGVQGSSIAESFEFDAFIQAVMVYLELPLVRKIFTKFHANGVSMSRIDRFLMSVG